MRIAFLGSMVAILLGGGAAMADPDRPSESAGSSQSTDGWTTTKAAMPAGAAHQPSATNLAPPGSQPVQCAPTAGHAVCTDQGWCGPPGRYWASAEYLWWWTKSDNVPPLVTTGVPPGTGILGQPGTAVLYGGEIDYGVRPGARLTAGMWLDECQRLGVEVSTFWLCPDDDDFAVASPGSPILARPFFDPITGAPGSQLVAFPGLLAGGVAVDTYSKLKGCELNALCNLKCCYQCDPCSGYYTGGRLDAIVGVRYMELRERLTVTENIIVPAGVPLTGTFPNLGGLPFIGGTLIGVSDEFQTENLFYGAQVGLRGEYAFGGGLFVNATGKFAAGVMEQEVDIRGATAVVTPAGSAVAPGGLLAQPSNMGTFDRTRFATVSELNLNVGYQVDRHVRVFVGYTCLYVTNVARPGDQIDFVVNSTRVPTSLVPATGPARPAFTFRESDFWAQGFSIGAEVRY